MADGIEVKLTGIDEAVRALNELADDMRRRVVMGALRDAGRPVSAAAKLLAPVLQKPTARRVPGTLRRAIGVFRSKRYKAAQGALGVYITVRASRAQRRKSPVTGDPFYFRFVEAGHRARTPKTGKSRRRAATAFVRPYPFLGPAFRAQGQHALDIFTRRIEERIAKANALRSG